jgi:hypothetical protein
MIDFHSGDETIFLVAKELPKMGVLGEEMIFRSDGASLEISVKK